MSRSRNIGAKRINRKKDFPKQVPIPVSARAEIMAIQARIHADKDFRLVSDYHDISSRIKVYFREKKYTDALHQILRGECELRPAGQPDQGQAP